MIICKKKDVQSHITYIVKSWLLLRPKSEADAKSIC